MTSTATTAAAAAGTQQMVCNSITLKGSVDIVTEFFEYGINSILYQRGLYPSDRFNQCQKYGLTLLMTIDDKLKTYLQTVLSQLKTFMLAKNVHKVVLVIVNVENQETVERWEFLIECDQTIGDGETKVVDEKEVQNGIRNVIRQIVASVTFLPLLEGKFIFDILLYTDKNTDLPSALWLDSNPHLIPNAEEVELKNFSTNIHKVKAMVSYKNCE
ncbi:mitotic spindle assembly checkpoint protein MAD2A-like [Oppia nitens]|uniref:mitotic spindle assembly checkpoint protein MAD2A-like n=1 Tax=Oppia nitens TaxID=1686743 RepID=UPI0023DAE201|nr:mitotic spindle assembly checkpoint protein MAD2A-like [Oppia nitens]XP_054167450.1 mitotic spindle assembly checkpoint protein MAD2A-like [Oppia nitens]XP_054167451.1 mitotic spindle assembly checkpoint protein MAD2A-like [Oppia nitens]